MQEVAATKMLTASAEAGILRALQQLQKQEGGKVVIEPYSL